MYGLTCGATSSCDVLPYLSHDLNTLSLDNEGAELHVQAHTYDDNEGQEKKWDDE